MPGTVAASEAPTVSLSFANNFWGKEDAGVTPLLTRMHSAKTTGDELKAFYAARAAIEEDYAKKLLSLAKKPLGGTEQGTLRMSLDVVKAETDSMGKQHAAVAHQMKTELDEPLIAFVGGIKERRKIVQTGIEKLLKAKNAQTMTVNKTRDRFEQDCLKIKGYLAQGHMVMGQEERKNKAKLEKTQAAMSGSSSEYEIAVKVLEETTGKWNREWKAACDKFQDLEEERIDFFKSSLWSFANISSTVCVSDDQSCEKVRLSLEDCDVEKDITNFIQDSGTGQEIPDPPKYINFCRGDVDDAASSHESDDGEYSVAQFQRTMNPTYRTSSPQPSTFESHHDPDSSLRDEMGVPKGRTSIQDDHYFNPRGSTGSGAPPPLNPSASSLSQSQLSQSHPDPYADAPRIPHNPFPTDGMTQFCRPGAPSERSSNPSPVRPASSASLEHSDYTNPTSLSDMEMPSGHQSPTKGFNPTGSALSGMSSGGEEKAVQKKKSGFFSNSPFRRRSQKNKDAAPAPRARSAAPTNRNTWAPQPHPQVAPQPQQQIQPQQPPPSAAQPRPFGAHARSKTWQAKQPSPTPEPEQADPRAEYQLGVGGNVFDVASPVPQSQQRGPSKSNPAQPPMDPIAQALAELKGVTKQTSVRQSADRHYGMSTPAPDPRVPAPFAQNGQRNTPPPAYDPAQQQPPPMSRMGVPHPAHTSRDMQRTTERFVAKQREVFSGGGASGSVAGGVPSRPASRAAGHQQPARATSPAPAPLRSISPRPGSGDPRMQQQQGYRAASPRPDPRMQAQQAAQQQNGYRAASPNPYARPRAQSSSPVKPAQPQSYGSFGRSAGGGSPGYATQQGQPPPRAASPNPAFARSSSAMGGGRPGSSRGSEMGGGGMAMALASPGARPASSYYGGGEMSLKAAPPAGGRGQFTREGRSIVHYSRAMYMYQAAIPEELSFNKGDILAVLRLQDDGWWEAEVVGKGGRAGLVPSNYLKNC